MLLNLARKARKSRRPPANINASRRLYGPLRHISNSSSAPPRGRQKPMRLLLSLASVTGSRPSRIIKMRSSLRKKKVWTRLPQLRMRQPPESLDLQCLPKTATIANEVRHCKMLTHNRKLLDLRNSQRIFHRRLPQLQLQHPDHSLSGERHRKILREQPVLEAHKRLGCRISSSKYQYCLKLQVSRLHPKRPKILALWDRHLMISFRRLLNLSSRLPRYRLISSNICKLSLQLMQRNHPTRLFNSRRLDFNNNSNNLPCALLPRCRCSHLCPNSTVGRQNTFVSLLFSLSHPMRQGNRCRCRTDYPSPSINPVHPVQLVRQDTSKTNYSRARCKDQEANSLKLRLSCLSNKVNLAIFRKISKCWPRK